MAIPGTSKSQDVPVNNLENKPSTSKDNLKSEIINLQIDKSPQRVGMLASKNKYVNNAHFERLRRLDVVSQRIRKFEFNRGCLAQDLQIQNLESVLVEIEKIPSKKQKRNQLTIFVLDISKVISEECSATWLQNDKHVISKKAPEETILYSLVAGKGELIMFGGIKREADNCSMNYANPTEQVSNTLHFIRAPKCVI